MPVTRAGRAVLTRMSKTKLSLSLALAACAACVDVPPEAGEAADEITGAGATSASQFHLDRAAATPGCTATRIAPNFALTAIHCGTGVGANVDFYDTGPGTDAVLTAHVAAWIQRDDAIDITACHDDLECYDTDGNFADLALLQLGDMTPAMDGPAGAQATLAWTYPGSGAGGYSVGAGRHGDLSNPERILKQIWDTTDDGDADDGAFHTTNDFVNPQDSGGPFYVGGRELGVLHGHGWDVPHGNFDKYTSVPLHLDWILGRIGYAWPGTPTYWGLFYDGTTMSSFSGSERVCQYACEETSTCEAYNYYVGGTCRLLRAVTGWHTQVGWRGALHFGAATGKSNQVVGYRRGDGYSAVLHKGNDGTLHELYNPDLQWSWGSIAVLAGQPIATGARLSAYRRGDGVNAAVYRSTSGRVIEIALGASGWQAADLTAWGGPNASGDPVAYVRADGVSAVVYRAATGHVHELRLGTNGWIATDLTAVSGLTAAASGDVTPFVRADGLSSIVFVAAGQIVELFKRPGDEWAFGVPSSLTVNGAAPAALTGSRPYGSTRRNGVAGIVYRSSANRLVELRLESSGWRFEDLTQTGAPAVGGNPVAYVRTDGVDSIVYRSTTNQLVEVTRAPLATWNLSAQYGVPAVTTDPAVYQRVDGYNAIVYGLAGNHVGELSWKAGEASWGRNDLTFSAGETP